MYGVISMNDDDLAAFAEELTDAAGLCNDELGEWWSMLANMWPRVRDCASDDFEDAYKRELREEYKRFKDEFWIEDVTETETVTVTHRTLRHESD